VVASGAVVVTGGDTAQQAVSVRLHFVSVLPFCLFDCLIEGITALFVFNHMKPYSTIYSTIFPAIRQCYSQRLPTTYLKSAWITNSQTSIE
jgi:hypothetical protein